MQKFKSECEILVKRNAVILLCDGFTKNGTSIYVTRKVIGLYGKKYGRGSEWGVCIDKPLHNGAERVFFKSIKGWYIDGDVSVLGLLCNMKRLTGILKPEQIDMIVSDARTRTKMAGEDNERCNDKAKPEEVKHQKIEKMLSAISYGKNFTCHSLESVGKYIDLVMDVYKELIQIGKTEQMTRRYLRSFGIPYNFIFKAERRLRLQYLLGIPEQRLPVRLCNAGIQIKKK